MQLYSHPASPNCMAVMMVASQLGLTLQTEFVDLMQGENARADFIAINPNGFVPVLRDGDFVLWETIPILQYLAAMAGDTPLWPRQERARAEIARWQVWSLAHWTPALQAFIFQNLFKKLRGLGEPDAAALTAGEAQLEKYGAVLNQQLARSEFVAADHLTLGDISVASYLVYAQAARIRLDRFPHVARWFTAVSATPSWQASHA